MSTKPNIAFSRFADQPGSDTTAPSSGLRDTGFVAGTFVVQSYINELFFRLHEWAVYLDDGALDGDHLIDGELDVAGDVELGGEVVLTGGNISIPTSDVIHLDRKVSVDAALARTASGTSTYDGNKVSIGSTSSVDIPLSHLSVGDRIKEVQIYFNRGSGTTITFQLFERSQTGAAPTLLCAKAIAAGSGALNTALSVSPTSGSLPQTIASNKNYFLRMLASSGDELHTMSVWHDRLA